MEKDSSKAPVAKKPIVKKPIVKKSVAKKPIEKKETKTIPISEEVKEAIEEKAELKPTPVPRPMIIPLESINSYLDTIKIVLLDDIRADVLTKHFTNMIQAHNKGVKVQ